MAMVKKRRFVSDVEDIERGTISKYKNKRCLLTIGGSILKPEHLNELRGLGMIPSGITFDSEMEAEYYRDVLLPMELAGEVEVKLQPKFVLIKEFEKGGVKYRPITYSPDFLVNYVGGRSEAIDVKGMQTETFNLKKKLFDFVFPDINLLIIKRVKKYGGWVTVEEYTSRRKQERSKDRSQLRSRSREGARKWN